VTLDVLFFNLHIVALTVAHKYMQNYNTDCDFEVFVSILLKKRRQFFLIVSTVGKVSSKLVGSYIKSGKIS